MAGEEPVDQKKYYEDTCKPMCVKPLLEYQKASEKMVKKKKISKASGTTRKVLSNISNCNRNKTPRKRKLNVIDEQFDEKYIEEERFEHDHEACMKAQHHERTMDMDYILETFGHPLQCFPKELSSLNRPEIPPSPPRFLEMEVPILDRSSYRSPLVSRLGGNIDCFSCNVIDPLKFAKH